MKKAYTLFLGMLFLVPLSVHAQTVTVSQAYLTNLQQQITGLNQEVGRLLANGSPHYNFVSWVNQDASGSPTIHGMFVNTDNWTSSSFSYKI